VKSIDYMLSFGFWFSSSSRHPARLLQNSQLTVHTWYQQLRVHEQVCRKLPLWLCCFSSISQIAH